MQEIPQQNIDTMAAIAIRYELQALEEFVKHRCHPPQEPMPAARPKRWEQFADAELNRIRGNMTAQVLSIAKPRHVELYIQHHQAGILQLSEDVTRLAEEMAAAGRPRAWQQFCSYLQEQLQELLDFLKHYFESYFDWQQVIPTYQRTEKLPAKYRAYLKVLGSYSSAECMPVVAMIRAHWEPASRAADYQLTFHRDQYFDTLFDALARQCSAGRTITDLVELLLQLNYNDGAFMDYCRMKIVAGLAERDTTGYKLQFLAERIKELKQLPLQKASPFNPTNPGVAGYCRQWMEEEYQFLQNSQRLWTNEGQPNSLQDTVIQLQTKLPVSQLGIFLHLMHSMGVMKLKNKTAFINFFARHLVTPASEAISEKNLRNSYYNMDFKAKEGIKDLLYEMLKLLRQTE